MKFCYFDESGMGSEPYLVVVGIVADASRMHITKYDWADLLAILSKATGRTVAEFHSRDFYRGNGVWRELDGPRRSLVVEAILTWVEERKHACVFSAIEKTTYIARVAADNRIGACKSQWCLAGLHCALQIQKQHQREKGVKGHSVLVFDREMSEERDLSELIDAPPDWIHTYYDRKKRQLPFDTIVDVPFFADSKHILLAQVADLFAYILRTWAEIIDGHQQQRYPGEDDTMKSWTNRIVKLAYPRSSRYMARGRCPAAQLFWELAPSTIRAL